MAKTLIDFRAEKGLYLKDVAETIDISEEELSKIETLNGIPDYIAEKLIVAYNLPEDYFSGEKVEEPIKPIKNLKSYFFKTSLTWFVVFTLILSIPISIFSILTPTLMGTLGFTISNIVRELIDLFTDVFTVAATIIYCNIFAKHIMKKTGLSGDIYKYRYLYGVIPSGVIAALSIVQSLITTWGYKESIADESKYYMIPITTGIGLVISVISMALVALIMASLLNTAIMDDATRKAKRHKTMAIIVTISSVLAYALTIYANTLEEYPTYNAIIRRIFVYGIYIVIAWLVYFAKDNNKNKESFAFEILPIISIVDTLLFNIISL